MAEQNSGEKIGVFKTVLLIYTILGLHLLLIAGLVFLIIVFRGVFEYTLWILLGGVGLVGFSAYYFWRRLKRQGRSLKDTLNSPAFQDRPVEISFMGGIANVKLGPTGGNPSADHALVQGSSHDTAQLEDRQAAKDRRIGELSRLVQEGVITQEEFERARQKLSSE